MNSQNGWLVVTNKQLNNNNFPGTGANPAPGVLIGGVATVLHYVGQQFDDRVEPLTDGWCWGYANRNVIGGSDISNHASGTAIDLNAPKHPLGKSGTFSAAQVEAIRQILAECGGVVRWGGDYSGRKDEMHFEIIADARTVAEVALRLSDGGSAPAPTPPVQKHYETVRAGKTYNIRTEAGTHGDIIAQVHGGEKYDTIVQGNGWRKLTFRGRAGYVSGDAFETPAPAPAKPRIRINKGTFNVRKKPSLSGTSVKIVSGGQVFELLGVSNGWYQIAGGYVGPKAATKI